MTRSWVRRPPRTWTCCAAALVCALQADGGGTAEPPRAGSADGRQGVAESLLVREVGVVFEPPPGTAELEPAALRLLEDGQDREVVKVEPLAQPADAAVEPGPASARERRTRPPAAVPAGGRAPADWDVLLYFDRAVTPPALVRRASLLLARAAGHLTGLGAVELVTADPRPRVLLPATRDRSRLVEALAALAGEARRARDQSYVARHDARLLRLQLDRCVSYLASPGGGSPRALLLVLGAAAAPPPGDPDAPAARLLPETARVFAAYGWVTVPLLPYDEAGAGPFTSEALARAASDFDDPQVPALRGLSRTTGGFLARDSVQLGTGLATLRQRWRLWYQTTSTRDGRPRSLEISLAGARLRAPEWVRASTPDAVAEARLRLLAVDGYVADAPLLLQAEMSRGYLELRVLPPPPRRRPHVALGSAASFRALWATPWTIEPPRAADAGSTSVPGAPASAAADPASSAPRQWRVSLGLGGAAAGEIAVRVGHCVATRATAGWRCSMPLVGLALPAGANAPIPVVADDLDRETWGATLAGVPAPPAH